MLDAVIFDFDGIIVDTEPLHHKAFNKVLEAHGLGFTWREYVARIIGFDDRDAFREAFHGAGRCLSDDLLVDLIARKAKTFHEVIAGGVRPFPGVIDRIGELAGTLPLALCSGALRSDIDPILHQLNLGDVFRVIVTADDVPVSKPDPAPYRLAFSLLQKIEPFQGIQAQKTLAIEDTPAGIASARGAGLAVLAITNSYRAETLDQADLVIDSLAALGADDFHRMIDRL